MQYIAADIKQESIISIKNQLLQSNPILEGLGKIFILFYFLTAFFVIYRFFCIVCYVLSDQQFLMKAFYRLYVYIAPYIIQRSFLVFFVFCLKILITSI